MPPTRSIGFVSDARGGHVSDKVITEQSGFLLKVEPDDEIMADRGINIGDDLVVGCEFQHSLKARNNCLQRKWKQLDAWHESGFMLKGL